MEEVNRILKSAVSPLEVMMVYAQGSEAFQKLVGSIADDEKVQEVATKVGPTIVKGAVDIASGNAFAGATSKVVASTLAYSQPKFFTKLMVGAGVFAAAVVATPVAVGALIYAEAKELLKR